MRPMMILTQRRDGAHVHTKRNFTVGPLQAGTCQTPVRTPSISVFAVPRSLTPKFDVKMVGLEERQVDAESEAKSSGEGSPSGSVYHPLTSDVPAECLSLSLSLSCTQ